MKEKYYLIYRTYSKYENNDNVDTSRIYGWTTSKSVLISFLKQRDLKKYRGFRLEADEFHYRIKGLEEKEKFEIVFIQLRSVNEEGLYKIFMTMNEMQECEKKIQRLLVEYSSIEGMRFKDTNKEICYFVNLFINLKPRFQDALHYIGYRPPEIQDVFDSVDSTEVDVEELIDMVYDGALHPKEYYNQPGDKVPGLSVFNDISNLILYSLEAFIKVLKNDM